MKETRLAKLKKASVSALKHEDLIELAKEYSPTQTVKLAQTGHWPPRQIKAAKALATLRKVDEEEFWQFLKTMEQARVHQSAAEHAQENREGRKTMEDKTKNALDRISSPFARIRLLTKREFHNEVLAELLTLVQSHNAMFLCNYWEENLLYDSIKKCAAGFPKSNEDQRERIVLVLVKEGENRSWFVVDILGLICHVQVNDEIQKLVSIVIRKQIANEPPFQLHWTHILPIQLLISNDDYRFDNELRQDAKIWICKATLRQGETFQAVERVFAGNVQAPEEIEDTLNPIVDHLGELGFSEEERCEEILILLREAVKEGRPKFILALAGCKCFDRGTEEQREERRSLLWDIYHPILWNRYIKCTSSGTDIDFYNRITKCGMEPEGDRRRRHEIRAKFFKTEFVAMLGRGELNRTYQLMILLFHTTSPHNDVQKYILEILPEAFQVALNAERYGIAAAMIQTFRKFQCYVPHIIEEARVEELKPIWDEINKQYNREQNFILDWLQEDGDMENIEFPEELAETGKEYLRKKGELQQKEDAIKKKVEELESEVNQCLEIALELGQPICFKDPHLYLIY